MLTSFKADVLASPSPNHFTMPVALMAASISTSENIERLDPQHPPDVEITGNGRDDHHHHESQPQIPKSDHRGIIRQPHLGECDGESGQSDAQPIACKGGKTGL